MAVTSGIDKSEVITHYCSFDWGKNFVVGKQSQQFGIAEPKRSSSRRRKKSRLG